MVSSYGSVDSDRKEGQSHSTATNQEVLLARPLGRLMAVGEGESIFFKGVTLGISTML